MDEESNHLMVSTRDTENQLKDIRHMPYLKSNNNTKIRQEDLIESQVIFKQVRAGILRKVHTNKQRVDRKLDKAKVIIAKKAEKK